MRRYLLLLGVVVVLSGLVVAAWWVELRRSSDHEAMRLKFRQIKLGMTVQEVDDLFGFPGEPWMGTEDVILWQWRRDGDCVELNIGQEDGKVKGGDFNAADGKQYWLLPEK